MKCFVSLVALLALAASSPTGATCVAAGDGVAAIGGHGGTDLVVDGNRRSVGDLKRNVFGLAFVGERLLEVGGLAGRRGEVRCWDWKSGKLLWEQAEGRDLVMSVAVAGDLVYAGTAERTIAVFELATGKPKGWLTGHAGAVLALAASPDGKTLVSGGVDRSIRVWSLPGGELVRAINNHGDTVHALAWSPDGRHLASGSSDRTVRVWQPAIGRLVRIVRGHDTAVLSLVFTGEHIVSGGADGRIRFIDASSDAVEATLDGHEDWIVGLAATKDGLLAADGSGDARLWRDGKSRPVR